mgnify:CR=1 FL=1
MLYDVTIYQSQWQISTVYFITVGIHLIYSDLHTNKSYPHKYIVGITPTKFQTQRNNFVVVNTSNGP